MSYHVAIVRTPTSTGGIREEEVVASLRKKDDLVLQRDDSGSLTQVVARTGNEGIVLFYDDQELWTKNPSGAALQLMIGLAADLGRGARVRGDEGETYESVEKTFQHPDDAAAEVEEPRFYWAYWAPKVIKVVLVVALVLIFGQLGLRKLGWI